MTNVCFHWHTAPKPYSTRTFRNHFRVAKSGFWGEFSQVLGGTLGGSASPTTSLTSSLLPSLLLLDPSHRHHPHYRVLVELALAVHHTVSLGSLDPHALVHLPCHRWLKRFKYLHWKIYMLAFMLYHAVFPEGILFAFQPQPICLLLASRVSIVSSLTIIFCAPSSPQAAQTANSVPWSVPLAIASPSGAREAVIPLSPFLLQRLCLCHRPHHIPSSLNPRNPPKKTKTFSSVYHILFKTQTHDLRRRVNCRIWGSSMSRAVETVCDGNWSDSDNCMAQ